MKKIATLIAFTLSFFFNLKSFSQVTYPCGVYFLGLNGTTDYGAWDKVYPTNDYTLAAWVQTTDVVWQGKEMDIFQRQVGGFGDQDGLDLYIAGDGTFKFRAYTFKNGYPTLDSLGSGIKPEPKKWYHVAVTFQSTGICNIYINGNLAASKSFGGAMSLNYPYLNYLAVGCKVIYPGGSKIVTFKGNLDELAVAEKALTQDQIRTLANGLSAGDPFFVANSVDSYDKEDTYPNRTNLGIGGGSVAITGQLYYCQYNPPIANAGPDQTIILPANSVTLSGNATPGTGTIVGGVWSKVSGPAGGDISDPNSQTPIITNLQEGTYVFKLTITDDKGVTGTDEVSIFVKPSISVQIIDPNPSMILDDGSLSADQSKIGSQLIVAGAATDGVTKLLLIADATVPITFSLPDPKDGALYSLDEQGTLTTQISITPQNGKAVCVYEVPDGYGVNNPPGGRNITIQAYYTSDQSHQTDKSLRLVTPPVVLVHGMWSGPTVWQGSDGFVSALGQANFLFPPFLADYSNWGASTFDPFSPNSIYGRGAVQSAINDGLKTYRNNHFAVTQADVIGHSLGGLMARSFSQQGSSFSTKETYKHGYIHKLITLGTPTKGSPYGPFLYNKRDVILNLPLYNSENTTPIPLVSFLNFADHPIGLCHRDFDENGPAIQNNLLATTSFYTYSIGGNYEGNISNETSYQILDKFVRIIAGKSHAQLFHVDNCANDEPENDIIVPMYSQMSGNKMGQIFSGTSHLHISLFETSETNSPEIQSKVIQLLLSDDPSNFNPGFIKASEINDDCDVPVVTNLNSSSTPTPLSASSVLNTNQAVQITAPARGMIVQQNNSTNITLQYQVLNGAVPSSALFMIKNVGWFTAPTVAPYSISITLPDSVAMGNLNIALLARDTSGIIMADTSSIIITPNGNLDNLSVNPGSIYLDSILRVASFSVQGYYSGGTISGEADITSSSAGTTYTSKKGNSIFKVSQDGVITAVSPGMDTLIISNSGKIAKLPVTVDSNFKYVTLYTNGIDFPPISNKLVNDAPFVLVASDSSAEDVVFNLVSGPVTLQNGVVTITGTGTVTVEATSTGDAYFANATPVYRTFQITSALPLTLLNFSGSLNSNNEILLNWQTAQEINTSHFDIERSADGNNFSSIGQVNASVNSSTAKNYAHIDLKPLQNVNYYRLKMVDADGKFTYSKIIAVKNDNENLFRIFPNPANDILYVQDNGANGFVTLKIFDASGRKLKEEKIMLNGNAPTSINIKGLPKGIYNLLLKSKTINEHQKFVKK